MASVKNCAFVTNKKLKNLRCCVGPEYSDKDGLFFPFDLLHYLLPLKLKFSKESYVVFDDNGEVQGVAALEKDETGTGRMKLIQLSLKGDVFKYGEILINYIVDRFLAMGAKSFCTAVDEMDDMTLKLFFEACKFRIMGDEYLFKVKKSDFPYEKGHQSYDFIRFCKNSDTKKIAELYNSQIASHQKPSFEADEKYFNENIFVGLKNNISFKYVLENTINKKFFGFFTITTRNGNDFALECILASGYEVYLSDILKYTKNEISKRSSSWTLYIRVRSYFSNYKSILEILKGYDFKCAKKLKILTKDLYKAVKADSVYKKQIIFNDITPAY